MPKAGDRYGRRVPFATAARWAGGEDRLIDGRGASVVSVWRKSGVPSHVAVELLERADRDAVDVPRPVRALLAALHVNGDDALPTAARRRLAKRRAEIARRLSDYASEQLRAMEEYRRLVAVETRRSRR